jgi:hypothetical protein
VGAGEVGEEEDKSTHRTFLDFFGMQYYEFLNSVLSTILKMKPSFFRFLCQNF